VPTHASAPLPVEGRRRLADLILGGLSIREAAAAGGWLRPPRTAGSAAGGGQRMRSAHRGAASPIAPAGPITSRGEAPMDSGSGSPRPGRAPTSGRRGSATSWARRHRRSGRCPGAMADPAGRALPGPSRSGVSGQGPGRSSTSTPPSPPGSTGRATGRAGAAPRRAGAPTVASPMRSSTWRSMTTRGTPASRSTPMRRGIPARGPPAVRLGTSLVLAPRRPRR